MKVDLQVPHVTEYFATQQSSSKHVSMFFPYSVVYLQGYDMMKTLM